MTTSPEEDTRAGSADTSKRGPSGDGKGLIALPFVVADIVRFVVDLIFYGVAFLASGMCFVLLWQSDAVWVRVIAFPAAYVALVVGFYIAVLGLRILFLRKIVPGRYNLSSGKALRWIVADSLMRLVERSFLRGYLKDFTLQRYLFYRAMGAKIDISFLIGWDTKILDPWALEVGRGALIGSFSVITGHAVEGDTVTIQPVKIGNRATIGVRAVLLPGVEVGDGAIVGAGALVTKGTKIPAGEIWAGMPARKIGEVSAGEEV